ncbi:MAG: hypothetical protein JW863_06720 [Chitinispirillaceae bacterium]|nr:hypothetical protein [Chitinispirillaceae bacterium]
MNEYYGDWKWVHDPTAKINIVCHSNDGLIVTNALKNDSIFYNDGNSYSTSSGYYINGLGIRLSDHVNLVQTVDTPFAETEYGVFNKYSGFQYEAVRLLVEAAPDLAGSLFNNCNPMSFAIKQAISPLVQMFVNEVIVHDAAGTGTAVAKTMQNGGAFLNGLKGDGKSPAFSDQLDYTYFSQEPDQKIPYINYQGITSDVGVLFTALEVASVAALSYNVAKCFFPIPGFCNPCAVHGWANTVSLTNMLRKWAFESDLIVPAKSQRMLYIYTDMDRSRYKLISKSRVMFEPWHSAMPLTMNDEILRRLNPDPVIKFTHAIGANQIATVPEDSISLLFPVEYAGEDVFSNSSSNNYVESHPIASFNGMTDTSNPAMQWPAIDSFGTIRTNAASGSAVQIVGYIKNSFMNLLACSLSVNGGWKTPLIFYRDYGKWTSRCVDRDGDNRITDNDWPGGSWFFTPDISCYMHPGENSVVITAGRTDDTYPLTVATPAAMYARTTVVNGKALRLFEADSTGLRRRDALFNMPIRWNISGNEVKSFYVAIADSVTRYSSDGIWIVTDAPPDSCDPPIETQFNETFNCAVVGAGEFCAQDNPSMPGHFLINFNLNPSWFRVDGSDPAVEQNLHFSFYENSSGEFLHKYVPFYIDNERVSINLFSPSLLGDFNGDGIVDSNDSCGITNDSLPATCDSVSLCGGFGLSSEECDSAISACNNLRSNYSEFLLPDCDGIDNDFDGAADATADISEMTNIEYYSPQFNTAGKLLTPPMYSRFTITDNLQAQFTIPRKLEIRVYKVAGYTFNPSADQLLFAEDHGSDGADSVWQYGEHSFLWPFVKNQGGTQFDSLNPPPDGLYCMVVAGCDIAGDTATADLVVSDPGYFIVDRTPPTMTILKNWHDPANSDSAVIQSTTTIFEMSYRPGPAGHSGPFSDRFDSETEDVTAYFHQYVDLLNTGITIPVGYYVVSSTPSYQDRIRNSLYLSGDPAYQGTDGDIDPTTCYIETQDYTNPVLKSIRRFLVPALGTGKYTVEYVFKDKAGNVGRMHDTNLVITVNRDEGFEGATEDGRIGVDSSESSFDENTGEGVVTSTGTNTESNSWKTDDGFGLNYVPAEGAFSIAIRVDSLYGSFLSGGIVARQSLDVSDVSIMLEVDFTGKVWFSYRSVRGATRIGVGSADIGRTSGVCLWLQRFENGLVSASYSLDCVNYTSLGTISFGTQDLIVGPFVRVSEGSATLEYTKVQPPGRTWEPVQPIANTVVNNCDGSFTASFGYNNPNASAVALPYGSRNWFFNNNGSFTVPECPAIFEPGSHSNVFTVDFNGSTIAWFLDSTYVTATGVPAACEPVIIPGSVSGYAVYGFNRVDLADRSELICGSGKCATASGNGGGVTIGVQSKVRSIESRGPVFLRNYADCSDFIKSADSVNLQSSATCPSITPFYTFPAEVLPSSASTGSIDFTGVPQADTFVESYQTKTLSPGTFWNYTCRANGKLKLSAGTYYFHNLHMENNSIIECTVSSGSVKVFVENYYYSGATCTIVGGDASKVLYGYIGTNTVTVDKLKGTLVAPNATIEAGGWAPTFYGQLIGKEVVARPDFKLYYQPFAE